LPQTGFEYEMKKTSLPLSSGPLSSGPVRFARAGLTRIGLLSKPLPKPMALLSSERHVMWLKQQNIAFIRVPKAANSSVRIKLARCFGLTKQSEISPNKDRFWRDIESDSATSMTTSQFATRQVTRDCWSFTVVRNPVARLYSCWNNKVIENEDLSKKFLASGVRSGMPFDEFVDCVARTDEKNSDIHVWSMKTILCHEGRVVPDFVGRVETIDRDWKHICYEVQIRTGTKLGPMLQRNVRGQTEGSIFDTFSPETKNLILQKYKEDFELFYPEFYARETEST
jgi:dermatan 4-sulfotransferase 1